MPTRIKDDLFGVDTKDTCNLLKKTRKYNYTLKASGGGKLSFKIKYYVLPELGESGRGRWVVTEKKSKIASGTTLDGTFTPGKTYESEGGQSKLQIVFSRAIGTAGVAYDFVMEPA